MLGNRIGQIAAESKSNEMPAVREIIDVRNAIIANIRKCLLSENFLILAIIVTLNIHNIYIFVI